MYRNHIKVPKIVQKYTKLLNRVALNRISFLVKKVAKKRYYQNEGLGLAWDPVKRALDLTAKKNIQN